MTLTAAFRASARRHGGRPALDFEGERYSHAELDVMSDALACELARRGIGPGDRVGVYLANAPALVLAHLAIGKLNAIRLCINPAYHKDELAFILEDADPALVFTEPANVGAFDAVGHRAARIVPGVGRDPYGVPPGVPPAMAIAPHDPALLAYTSGTTGRSKGALLSQANLLTNIATLAELWRWTAEDRLLLALPMFHIHGLALGLHGSLLTGSSIVLHRKFDAKAALAALERERCTLFMGVPTMYRRLLDTPDAADLSGLRLMISGSAALPVEVWHGVKARWGHAILERYGLSETIMNASNPCDGVRKPGTVGPPLSGVEIRLAGATAEAPEGEIRVRGPNVMCGYWRRPDATAEVMDEDGFFRTGDLGRFDADGYLTISGRSKELIITGGYNVFPREVEECLERHPSVAECAVVGAPDPAWGERVTAFVVLRAGVALDAAALAAHVAGHLVHYKVPKTFHAIDALPRNPMGKLTKQPLVARAAGATQPESPRSRSIPMDSREMIDLCKQHTLFAWAANDQVEPLAIARAEGVYLYTTDGQRILDFNSQLMSVNIGHSHPKVIAAIKRQLDEQLLYVYTGMATAVRARVGKLLSEIVPGDIDLFFFTLGGAEANENAIRAARLYTGRQKILSRYRSYHGGTNACMQMTGDPRRWPSEPGGPGYIRVMDPMPYSFSFGATEAEITANNLRYLEEVIAYEGPHTIAAMIIETVTGTNGILPPPAGYLAGLKALLSKHGILLICDEIMCGLGRTGKMFAFEHGGIVPDILTMAKGLTSSYLPLGAMGLSRPIADHFRKNVFWGGLTYNSHPMCLAAAEAAIGVLRDEGMVANAARLEGVMRSEMARLKAKHPSFKEGRAIGLFGMIDLAKNAKGDPAAPYNGSSPAMKELAAFFKKEGLFTFVRWGSFMCNPPLCITEAQLREGFAIIDRGLEITDRAMEA